LSTKTSVYCRTTAAPDETNSIEILEFSEIIYDFTTFFGGCLLWIATFALFTCFKNLTRFDQKCRAPRHTIAGNSIG
jgi:hypothetical protein